MSILIIPPFTDPALAAQKVQLAEDRGGRPRHRSPWLGGSCTVSTQFSPLLADLQGSTATTVNGTLIVEGIEIAAGNTNVMITKQIPLTGTGIL